MVDGATSGDSRSPQPPQNFSDGSFDTPQRQITTSTAPHSAQKRRSARLSQRQHGQRTGGFLACSDRTLVVVLLATGPMGLADASAPRDSLDLQHGVCQAGMGLNDGGVA